MTGRMAVGTPRSRGGYFPGDYQGLAGGKELFHLLWISTLRKARSDSTQKQPDAYASRVSP